MNLKSIGASIKTIIKDKTAELRTETETAAAVEKEGGKATASGEGAQSTARGEGAYSASEGDNAQAIADGKNAKADAKGEGAEAVAQGENALAESNGSNAQSASAGRGAKSEAKGDDIAALAMGNYAKASIKDSTDSELNVVGEHANGEISDGSDQNSVVTEGDFANSRVSGDSDDNEVTQNGNSSGVFLENDSDGNQVSVEGNGAIVSLDNVDDRTVNVTGENVSVNLDDEGVVIKNQAGDVIEEAIYNDDGTFTYEQDGINVSVNAAETIDEAEETEETNESEEAGEEKSNDLTGLSWSEARDVREAKNLENGGDGTVTGDIKEQILAGEAPSYTVQNGDTLYEVAQASYQVNNESAETVVEPSHDEVMATVNQIAEKNGIEDPSLIYPGQQIDLEGIVTLPEPKSTEETESSNGTEGTNGTEEADNTDSTENTNGSDGAETQEVQALPTNVNDVPQSIERATGSPTEITHQIAETYGLENAHQQAEGDVLAVTGTNADGETVQFVYSHQEGGNNGRQGVPDSYRLDSVSVDGANVARRESTSAADSQTENSTENSTEDSATVGESSQQNVATAALDVLLDESNLNRSENKYSATEIIEAADRRSTDEAAGIWLDQNAESLSALTNLDGKEGELNRTEIEVIQARLAQGETLEDLVAEAEAINRHVYTQDPVNVQAALAEAGFENISFEDKQALSKIGNGLGGFEENELEIISNLSEQGFTAEQILDYAAGRPSTVRIPTVARNSSAVTGSEADNQAALEALGILQDESNLSRSEGKYSTDEIIDAADRRSTDEVSGIWLDTNAEDLAVLTYLDGQGGELNEAEVNDIINLLEAGVSFDYLVEEAQNIKASNARVNSDLFAIFGVEQQA